MKNFILVLTEADEEDEKMEEDEWKDAIDTHEEHGLELSMNSLIGLTSNKSYKLKGSINEKEVCILIDSGASTNFISKKLVRSLQLDVKKINTFMVELGNGQVETGVRLCQR